MGLGPPRALSRPSRSPAQEPHRRDLCPAWCWSGSWGLALPSQKEHRYSTTHLHCTKAETGGQILRGFGCGHSQRVPHMGPLLCLNPCTCLSRSLGVPHPLMTSCRAPCSHLTCGLQEAVGCWLGALLGVTPLWLNTWAPMSGAPPGSGLMKQPRVSMHLAVSWFLQVHSSTKQSETGETPAFYR